MRGYSIHEIRCTICPDPIYPFKVFLKKFLQIPDCQNLEKRQFQYLRSNNLPVICRFIPLNWLKAILRTKKSWLSAWRFEGL